MVWDDWTPETVRLSRRAAMTPTGIDNLLATDLGVVLSCGEELWLADDTLVAQRLLRRFPGARHGCRAMFASAAGGLFVAPDGPDLAASERGLWMSADRGATWTRVIDLGPLGRGATFAALAEDRDGRLFAGLCAPADAVANAMVYRSVDGGSTWAPSPVGAAGCHITDVATDRWSGATYATLDGSIASAPRVVRTTDGGATWDAILFELPRIGPMIIVAGARLFASRELGQARIFRSQDDRTYTTVLDDAIDSSFAWLRRSPSSGTLMAGTVRAGREGLAGIYRSVDDGRAWTLERSLPAPARGDGT
ncbi:MAG: WD40/YVTN/BNR-like repeat-containing protein, partial [Myxococcota bacterium]